MVTLSSFSVAFLAFGDTTSLHFGYRDFHRVLTGSFLPKFHVIFCVIVLCQFRAFANSLLKATALSFHHCHSKIPEHAARVPHRVLVKLIEHLTELNLQLGFGTAGIVVGIFFQLRLI